MNKLCIAVLGSMLMWAGVAFGQSDEIVTIDMQKVFNNYYRTELANAQLQDEGERAKAELKKMETDFESMNEAFGKLRDEAKDPALSMEARNRKRDEAEEKLVELRDFEAKVRSFAKTNQQKIASMQANMQKRIVDRIKDKVEDYAREQGYLLVLDQSGLSANGVSVIVFSSPRLDISDEVLAIMNKDAQE